MRVITICGSLRFQEEMMKVAQEMVLKGDCILTPTYKILKDMEPTYNQLTKITEAHFKRIELSDAILVLNINNYIGVNTILEIEYAKKLGKEILYYTELIKDNTILTNDTKNGFDKKKDVKILKRINNE